MSSIVYLHSARSDFAPTECLPEAAYLGRALGTSAPMRLLSCGCGRLPLVRIRRRTWMRFVPLFRLYRCMACGAQVFRGRMKQHRAYFQWAPGGAARLRT